MNSTTLGLNPNDVLMGRGSGANLKQGNIRFRQLVWDRYDAEMARVECKTMEAVASVKIKVAHDVLQDIQSKGGRFLRKVLKPAQVKQDGSGEDSKGRKVEREIVYEEVSDKDATEKIKQTLRFQIERHKAFRSGSSRGEDPTGLSFPPAISAASPFPDQAPATGNVILLPSIDDRLLQVISQARISRLLQGSSDDDAANRTLSTLNNIATGSLFIPHGSPPVNAWPPLLSAASAALTASKQSSSRRSRSLEARISKQGKPKPISSAMTTLFLPRHTIPLSPVGNFVTPQASSCLASPIGSKNFPPSPTCTLESLSVSTSSQLDVEALIRREEFQLILARIQTQRLTNLLRHSMTQAAT
jgi:hypothetical protein